MGKKTSSKYGYTWKEYQQFVEKEPVLREMVGELHIYYYFDTLQWGYRYAIVLNDNILIISEEYPWDFWYGAETVYRLMKQ